VVLDWEQDEAVGVLLKKRLRSFLLLDDWGNWALLQIRDVLDRLLEVLGEGSLHRGDVLLVGRGGIEVEFLDRRVAHLEALEARSSLWTRVSRSTRMVSSDGAVATAYLL
jgi:hypothetical protein